MLLGLASTNALSAPLSTLFEASFNGSLDATDAHGAVKPLSVEGKVAYAPGRTGQALICGGDGALVKYAVNGHMAMSQGTIEMWMKAVDWPKDEQAYHVFFETEGPGWLLLYKFWTGGASFLSGVDHTHTYAFAQWPDCTPLTDGQWHHLAGVWERTRLAFYVDGVLKKQIEAPPLPQALTGYFAIGDAPWSKPHTSHTLLQGVKIYRFALPDDQVALAAQDKPLTFQPKARMEIQPHPAKGEWTVIVDATGFVGENEPGVVAVVDVLSGANSVAGAKVESFKEGVCSVNVNISKVPVGAVVIKARVLDAAGKERASVELPFAKPADAPWIGNRIGMEDRVLAPFTAMHANGNDVECWGRKYVMGAGPFPAQIESAGQPILAAPIRVSVSTGKGEVAFQKLAGKVLGCTATRSQIAGSADAPEIGLTTETTIEYDGMLWTEVTLTPKAPVSLTEVTIHIPVRAAVAMYLHHTNGDWDDDNAGTLPAKGYESVAFQPFLWVGDNDRGLGWFAESMQGWSSAPAKPRQFIVRDGEIADMRISIVNQSTLIKTPLKFSFGLQATPVKPRPAEARKWRPNGALNDMETLGMGNIRLVWSNDHLSYYGYPWPSDPEKFRALVKDLHAKNVRVVPYVNLNFFSAGAPEWPYYSGDWIDHGRCCTAGDVMAMGGATYGACPHSAAWRDFIAWKIAKFVDEFQVDGIYVDCWLCYECKENHGCAWRDENGDLHGTYLIRDYREILRRVRELLQDRRPDPHIIVHMSAGVIIPIDAFADSMLDGEQYQGARNPKEDYLNVIPLDKWRAEHTGRQWGVVPFFLTEFTGPERLQALPAERLMGLMLTHDIAPWPTWCNSDAVFAAWKAMDKFGAAEAKFLPYWEPNGVTTDNKDVIVSVYQRSGAALLVVYNTGTVDAQLSLKADAKRLGLGAPLKARNPMDESLLPISDQGVKLAVPARTYRMVLLD